MRIVYTDNAENDLDSAFGWYESQRKGLGFDFLDSVEVSLLIIQQNPELYRIIYKNFRRSILRRFPFSIFYTIENDEIIIHSIFDNRQDPEKLPK